MPHQVGALLHEGEFDFHAVLVEPRRHSSIRQLAGMVEVPHQMIEVRRIQLARIDRVAEGVTGWMGLFSCIPMTLAAGAHHGC